MRIPSWLGAGVLAGWVAAVACRPDDGRATNGVADADGARAEAAAERVVAELFAAMNNRDADRVMGHYLPGDDLVHVACTTIRRGHAPLASIMDTWLEDEPDIEIQHRVVRAMAVSADAAVVAADGHREDGTALYWTFVVRRFDGDDWRVVQEHQSWAGCREQRVHPMS